MPKRIVRLTLLVVLIALVAVPLAAAAKHVTGQDRPDRLGSKGRIDNKTSPLKTEQQTLLKRALEQSLNGKTHAKAVEVARGQYVELAREGEYRIWTVLGEFSDFAHNNIAEPDRAYDNSTYWVPDFDPQHYMDMLYGEAKGANTMRNFYIEQSSGRFAVNGDVTDWVTVPGTAAYYDDNKGGVDTSKDVWLFLRDQVDVWYDQQIAAGKTPAEIDAYLAGFDLRDRYDYDGDGDFDEPDGYIDTFQSVHSGEDEADGGGALGSTAIWAHSWYANFGDIGDTGPDFNKFGGIQVGESSYWLGDYTIQSENGGVGVFAHEYGHDLGLPDLYDTEGDNDNAESFWTLMSDGSNTFLSPDGESKPTHMGVWEKFQLGWLNYQVASAGKSADFKLGPAETNTKQAQCVFVILPDKSVSTDIGGAFAGSNFYYSGSGNDLDNWMYKAFTLPAGASLTAKVRYDIELDWDYAYVVVSTDNGATWTSVETNLSTTTDPNGQNLGFGITGSSGDAWVDLSADLSAYTGNVLVGFRYWTDPAVAPTGLSIDDISVAGGAVDGAEADAGWTYKPATGGFHVSTGTESGFYSNYYVTEFRQYRGYDAMLKDGPYFRGYADDLATYNKFDHFPYQDGLLVSYWDTSQPDNNVSAHPGHGLLLAIDAHPAALYTVGGDLWRGRIQTYDATFGFEPTDAFDLHVNSVLSPIVSLPAVPVFNDTKSYYDPANPFGSVITPNTHTSIRVVSYSSLGNFMQIKIAPVGGKRSS
jgi:immune inhibitor A